MLCLLHHPPTFLCLRLNHLERAHYSQLLVLPLNRRLVVPDLPRRPVHRPPLCQHRRPLIGGSCLLLPLAHVPLPTAGLQVREWRLLEGFFVFLTRRRLQVVDEELEVDVGTGADW